MIALTSWNVIRNAAAVRVDLPALNVSMSLRNLALGGYRLFVQPVIGRTSRFIALVRHLFVAAIRSKARIGRAVQLLVTRRIGVTRLRRTIACALGRFLSHVASV